MLKAYKLHLDDEHKQVVMMLLKAREIGREAANDQFKKLQEAGPKFNVVERVRNRERKVGEMLDVCGGAYLTIPGRGKIIKAFKKLGIEGRFNHLGGMNQEYTLEDEHMSVSKNYRRGYMFLLGLNTGRQEMSVNEEAVVAASEFLNNAGLKCGWKSYID